jgi:hypothetical protein
MFVDEQRQETCVMPLKGVVDVSEQKRLNEAREAGVSWKKWGLT